MIWYTDKLIFVISYHINARESENEKRNDRVLTDEKEDSIASRMKRRRNQQSEDNDDKNNSYEY